ncbi:MAG: adenosylmethionine decarboxylase [Microcystaceae cyanobacterium]
MDVHSTQKSPDVHIPSGLHIIADCKGVNPNLLNDGDALQAILIDSLKDTGAHILEIRVQTFQPSGITLFAVLAESHASIHTYPTLGVAMLDLFTCGNIKARLGMEKLLTSLQPTHHHITVVERNLIQFN